MRHDQNAGDRRCTGGHYEIDPGDTGSEIALATLMREKVDRPCINCSWMTSSSYMSKVAGRDYCRTERGSSSSTCIMRD